MSMGAATGETREAVCGWCGRKVVELRFIVVQAEGAIEHWSAEKHNAPACGRNCMGGGTRPGALSTTHGWRGMCPTCGEVRKQ